MSNNLLDDQVRILVVDDSQELLDMLDEQLRHAGYSVTSTLSGQEALNILRQASQPDQRSLDLVILDIMMPDLDGIEVLESIHSDESLLDIPVLMLTCLESVDDKVRAFNAGANDYLTKPFDSQEVLVRVRSLLQQRETKQSLINANDNLTALQKSGQALLDTQQLPDVLQLILDQLAQVIDFDSSSVMLVHDNFLKIVAQQGFRSDEQLFSYDKLEKLEHVQKVLREQTPEIIPDTEKDERWYTLPDSEYIRCWLGVPLVVKGSAIGVLNIDKVQPNFYNESHVDLAVAFANQAAVAIENARLFQETKQKADELKAITDHLDRLVASSFDGIITADTAGMVTGFNAMAEKILGYQAVEVFGAPVKGLYDDPEEPKKIGKLLWENPEGKLTNYETYVKHKSGGKIPVSLSATWLFDAEENRIGSAGYISQNVHDLRETIKHRQLLLEAINAVAQAENLKDDLNILARKMVEACLSTFCLILFRSDGGRQLEVQAAYPAPRDKGLKWNPGIGKVCRPFNARESAAILGIDKPVFLRMSKKRESKVLKHIEEMTGLQGTLQSALVVPLTTGEERFGVCILGEMRAWNRTPFTKIEITLAQSMATQVAALIGKVKLHELTRRRVEELDTLQRLALTINSSLERGAVLNQACQAAVEFFKADHCGLVLFDSDSVQGEVVAEYPAEMHAIGTRIPLKGILLEEEIIRKKEPIVVYDIETEEGLGEVRTILHGQFGIQSSLYAPIILDGKVIGTFGIDATEKKRDFTSDVENSKLFAAHVITAIDKASVFERIKRNAKLTEAMVDVSRTLTGTRDLKMQMETVWKFVSRQLSAPMFYVGIYDEFKDELDFIVAYDMNQPQSIPPISLVEEKNWGPSGYVVKTRKQLKWYTNKQLEAFRKKSGIEFRQLGAFGQSSLILPLEVKDRIVGIIAMQSDEPNAWDDTEIGVFHTLAQLVGVAIRNTQLYQEKITGQKRLKAAYEASKDITSTLVPEKALHTIVKRACEVMGAWRATAVLIDEGGNPRHLASAGFEQNLELTTTIRRQGGISSQVVQTGEPKFFPDILVAKDKVHPKMLEQGVRAAVCLPFTYKGRNIGVLWVHYDVPHAFSETERDALNLYASQAAIAYENARRVAELEHMRQASESLAGVAGLQEVLEQIVQSARKVLQADSTAIWSYDAVKDRFILEGSVAAGISVELWEQFRREEPRRGQTAYNVMEQGWVGVMDVDNVQQYPFLGKSTRKLLEQIGVQSFQGIALTVGDERLGVLYVNYNHTRSFSGEERETAKMFANHAALALKKAKLLDQVKKARDVARVVAEVSALGDLHGTMQTIVKGTKDVLDCNAVTLYTYDQDQDKFDFPPAMVGVKYPSKVVELDYVERNSIPYRIIAMDDLYISEKAIADPLLKGEFTKREGIQSFVGIPLVANERKVGVMCVNYHKYHRFTNNELTNARLFAHQAAVAIQNAQQYDYLYRSVQHQQAVYKASKVISAGLNIGQTQLLANILEQALEHIAPIGGTKRATVGTIMLYDDNTNELILECVYPPHAQQTRAVGQRLELDRNKGQIGISGRAVLERKHQLVSDVRSDPDYLTFNDSTLSEVDVLLLEDDNVIGILSLESDELAAFDKEDMRALLSIAELAVIAIHNVWQYEELKHTQKLVGARTAVAWMGMISSAWRHAVGNSATTIQDLVDLTWKDVNSGATTEQVYQRLECIKEIATKIQKTPITAPLHAEEDVASVSINKLLRERVKQLWGRKPYKRVQFKSNFQLSDTVLVRTNSHWLRRAFDILIANAVEAMSNSSPPQLTISTHLVNNNVEITFTDTGTGICTDVLDQLLQKPIPKQKGEKGLGVGLLIADLIVQTYGGDIYVGETGPSGTAMIISLPVEH